MSQPIKDFDVACFIKAAEELLRSDETLRALHLLDNLPSWYRLHPPKEVTDLKRLVQSRIATASFYSTSAGYELTAPDDSYLHIQDTLRGHLLLKDIQYLNEKNITPHLLDFAPGEYAFVRMLLHKNCLFTYEPSFVNWPSYDKYKKHFEEVMACADADRPKVYFAGEILEHLHHEEELRYEMERKIGLADILNISTPNMTFDYMCTDFRTKGDLGHLRTYHAQEFMNTISKMFPEYHIQVIVSPILHARGVLKNTQFDIPKEISLG